MTSPLRLLACQIAIPTTPDEDARDAHMQRVAALIDNALDEAPADLVVLPELSTVDYSRESFRASTAWPKVSTARPSRS